MPSDDDSFRPSSSSDEDTSNERESQTLDELKKKMMADAEKSVSSNEDSSSNDASSSESSAEQIPLPRLKKKANKTPKKTVARKKSSHVDSNDNGITVTKTPTKKQIQDARESSKDGSSSSSSSPAPKTRRKRKHNTKKQGGKRKRNKSKTSTITAANTTGKGKKAGSTTFTPDELLLLSKAYMKVSCNAKHGTDKKAEKFWDDIALHYVELVGKANSINEDNIDFANIDILRNAESLRNCWQRRLQPSVQKFCGILSTNPPMSGEVKDDQIMDRYYSRMRQLYADQSHTFKRDVPKDFSKCMKAYLFLSNHPKFEVEIPLNPSQKRPSKNPNSIQAEGEDSISNNKEDTPPDLSFVIHPQSKTRPAGREATKRSDAVKYIVDEVSKRATDSLQSPAQGSDTIINVLQKTLSESNEHMRSIAQQQATVANHQVMMSAPSEICEKYFGEIYTTIQLETANRRIQEEVHQLELLAKKKQLEELIAQCDKNEKNNEFLDDIGAEDLYEYEKEDSIDYQSRWVQLARGGKVIEASDLLASSRGAEFACVHNRDSQDFMNESKFERFILKRTNSNNPPRWDLLNETATTVMDHIVEDEDQGPSKEWGPYSWYRPPTEYHVKLACSGKTIA